MLKHTLSSRFFKLSIAVLSILGYGTFVFAVGPFAPGTELDPTCTPYINNNPLQGVDTDCLVAQAWQQNIADGFIFNLNQKIGIGTNTPTATLDVVGSFAQSQEVAGATGLGYVFMNQFSNTINSAVSTTGSSYHGLSSQLVVDYDLGATMGQGFLPPSNALNAYINNISSGDVDGLLGGLFLTTHSGSGQLNNLTGSTSFVNSGTDVFIGGSANVGNIQDAVGHGVQIGVAGDGDMVNARGLSVIIRNFNDDYGLGNSGVINQAQGYSVSADTVSSIPGISANNIAAGISFFGTSLVPAITSPGDVYGFRISEHALDGGTNEFGISVEDTEALNLFMGNTAFGVANWANDSDNGSLKLKVEGALKASYNSFDIGVYNESFSGQPTGAISYMEGPELWGHILRDDSMGEMTVTSGYVDLSSIGPNGMNRSTDLYINEVAAILRYQTENRADPLWDKQNGIKVDQFGTTIWGDDGDNTSYNMRWNDDVVGGIAQLTNAGNMIIGSVDTPTDRLHVIGDVRVGTASTNGCLKDFSGGTITGTCSSDERLKTNIADVDTVLDRFTEIQLVTYDWNNLAQQRGFVGNTSQLGVLAQNVETYFPELVVTDSDGYKQVNYARLQLLSIQAIKELDIKIEAIESFASSINTTFIGVMRDWLGDVGNGLEKIVASVVQGGTIRAQNQLCVGQTCVSEAEFIELLNSRSIQEPPTTTSQSNNQDAIDTTSTTDTTASQSNNQDVIIDTTSTTDTTVDTPEIIDEPLTPETSEPVVDIDI